MIDQIKQNFENEIKHAKSSSEVESLRVKFIGKSGLITEQMKVISTLPIEERKAYGASINSLKDSVNKAIDAKMNELETLELSHKLESETIDISLPPRLTGIGTIHPISNAIAEIRDIFEGFGFEFADGPEIEDDWHNFTALNIAENHPARQMHDTFHIKGIPGKLLRTHTSNVQIRQMSKKTLPISLFTIGKTFRYESDATHSPMFHQLEGMYIDRKVSIGQLKFCLEQFLQKFFQVEKAPIRLRASHFPFTEPSVEVDVKCDRSTKDQIIIGQGEDWVEILGAGMIHPTVLANCGIDPEEYQGFAFGCGAERLAMLKYNISDLRKFYEGDLRWLKHYGF
jgi:phenylalanyl-tRNA synthetase alpha chain